ncbi:MAG: response regulator transcription factor [Stenotrophomonas maltophilia]
MDDLKVLIVADDPLARAGLAAALTHGAGVTVVGQIEGKSATPSAVDVFRPTVVVWDLGWESDGGPAAGLEQLSALSEGAIPIVTLVSDQRQAVGAWLAGSRGLLLRASPGASLRAAVRAVSQGLMALDPELSPSLLPAAGRPAGPEGSDPIPRELSPRETQVLQLLAEGSPNKVIASQLDISEHTVKFHINSIMGKLGAQSRTDAVMRATRSGLILL